MEFDDLCSDGCRFAQHCHLKPVEGMDPEDCSMYWKLEDYAHDAELDYEERCFEEEAEEEEE